MKVITLHPQLFAERCRELQELVTKAGFAPDVVVGIATGGEIVAAEMFKDLKHVSIACRRPSTTKIKKRFPRLRTMLRKSPLWVRDWMRRVEAYVLRHQNHKVITIDPSMVAPEVKEARNILIVDDTIDSGATLRSVINVIKRVNPGAKLFVAVLVVTTSDPYEMPDVMLYEQAKILIRFPWSIDYR